MARYLSPEWFEEVDAAASSAGGVAAAMPAGLRLVIQQVVTEAPGRADGEVAYVVRLEDGGVRVVPGRAEDADVTVTEDHATAVAVHRGELAAPAAFMTGRIRVSGNTQALLPAQAALHGLDRVFVSVRDRTTYDDER